MQLIVLRHGATQWNLDRRIQGHCDPPLAPSGRAQVVKWLVPPAWLELRCCVSPLRRALETAALLGFTNPKVETALIEMDWGQFEGRTLTDLRAEGGYDFAANEAAGLDFRPQGGESPREVMTRTSKWLESLSSQGRGTVVVTHKGVRRALLALTTGWDMRGPAPLKLRDEQAMLLELKPCGQAQLSGVHSLEATT